jgi:hypothetical protein|tara:strand:- start:96 stop:488 length:393 start_codon:yes stop_codon:yes gene_type:complete
MKKLLLLLLLVPMVSCSSDDDNTRTTDPLIDTWIRIYNFTYNDGIEVPNEETLIFNSNGTSIYTDVLSANGVWQNNGTDFNLLNQSYSLSFDNDDESTSQIRFESDFNSFIVVDDDVDYGIYDDNIWRRQ